MLSSRSCRKSYKRLKISGKVALTARYTESQTDRNVFTAVSTAAATFERVFDTR